MTVCAGCPVGLIDLRLAIYFIFPICGISGGKINYSVPVLFDHILEVLNPKNLR